MTKDKAREAAIRIAGVVHKYNAGPVLVRSLVSGGFDVGYEAAVAAERERIVAELGAAMKDESLMDAYDEGYNDGLVKAIEIVKGGEDGS